MDNVKYLRKTDYAALWHSGREVAKILSQYCRCFNLK
jgi:hypothetical protein